MTGTEKCLAANATVYAPDVARKPPLAKTLCVPMMTLFTRDINAKIAESGITVVSILDLARLIANWWPWEGG